MSADKLPAVREDRACIQGGYSDHPLDPGGATNLGITLAELAKYRGRSVSKAEVRALTWEGAASRSR